MNTFLQVLILFLTLLHLLSAGLLFYRLRQPTSMPLWALKVFVSALSPVLLLVGLTMVLLGWFLELWIVVVLGGLGGLLYLVHMVAVTREPDEATGFASAFVPEWAEQIPPQRKAGFLPRRYVGRLPKAPEPVFEQNLVFHTIPETGRELLCDVWQPGPGINRSGLAFIYLHGSAWTILDKDYGTRPFFRHLAARGHVIMDVAYRLFPETDFTGMVHDARHAVAWMKANAAAYGVTSDRIVIGGGSAGGHIALLSAYTEGKAPFTPADLEGVDTGVRSVISLYGPSDLTDVFYHTGQHLTERSALADRGEDGSGGMPPWLRERMGENFQRLGFDKKAEPGRLSPMLGGSPEEQPEAYALFSPVSHVHQDCPSTLLLNGTHDIIASPQAARQLYVRLREADVPAVLHLIPQTDHAFDLILPKISPSAQNAYYDIERFVGWMA